MTKITKFTSSNLDAVHADVIKAMQEVCDKHGIAYKKGGTRYSDSTAKFSIELLAAAGEGAITADKGLYEKYASRKGLNPKAFGVEFEATDGNLYTVSGIKPKGKKYSLLAVAKSNDKQYGMPLDMLPAKIKFGGQL